MADALPTLLIPGLIATARLFTDQLPALWRLGPVLVADHRQADSMAGLAADIMRNAPPRFRLLGLSMGGYVALEIMRQVPDRIAALALLDTSARPDAPEQSQGRRDQVTLAREQGMSAVADLQFPRLVSPAAQGDESLRQLIRDMAEDTGPDAFARQQQAIITRPDSRPSLSAIACPTLMIVGDQDQITPPPMAEEIVAAVPGAKLVVIPDSGHLSTLDQPTAVTRVLVKAWG